MRRSPAEVFFNLQTGCRQRSFRRESIKGGEEIFINQCYACHTIDGFNNDIVSKDSFDELQRPAFVYQALLQVHYFMPPFAGTDEEADALAAYIAGGLHGKEIVSVKEAEQRRTAFLRQIGRPVMMLLTSRVPSEGNSQEENYQRSAGGT